MGVLVCQTMKRFYFAVVIVLVSVLWFPPVSVRALTSVNASQFNGSDLGAKINAAFATLSQGEGEVVVSGGGTLATQVVVPKDKTLRFTAGTYTLVKDPILMKENTQIIGSGWDTILVEPTTANYWTVIAGYYGYTRNGDADTNLVVRNLQIKGANPGFNSTPQTISFGNVKRGVVDTVWLNGTRTIGIQAGGAAFYGNVAEDIWFTNNKFTNVASQDVAGVNVRRMTVAGNVFDSPGQAGGPGNTVIDLEPNTEEDKIEEIAILNNTLYGKNAVQCPHGNFILYQPTHLAPHTGGPAIIAGNSMESDDLGNSCFRTSNGIMVAAGAHDVQIFNNSLRGCGQSCLWLRGSRLWVYNNTLTNGGTGGLSLVNIGTTDSFLFNNTLAAPYAGANTGINEETGSGNKYYNNGPNPIYDLNHGGVMLQTAPVPPVVAKAASPVISVQAGTITITAATAHSEVHYTTDGSEPTLFSPIYTTPFSAAGITTVKAKAFRAGIYDSDVVTQAISGNVPVPTVTPTTVPTPTPTFVIPSPTPTAPPTVPSTPAQLPYASNSLINDNGTIYLIIGPAKIPFTSLSVFTTLGYSLKQVQRGSTGQYRLPNSSYLLNSPSMAHPWGAWVLHNRTVYYVHENGLIPVPTWDIFLQNGGKAEQIVKANSADIAEIKPGVPLLTLNDNRVVR